MEAKELVGSTATEAHSMKQGESEHSIEDRKQSSVDRDSGHVDNTSGEESLSDIPTPEIQTAEQQTQKIDLKGPSHSPAAIQDKSTPHAKSSPPPDPRIAKQQARLDALKSQLNVLTEEVNNVKALLRNPDASATVARHIKLLHEYNEIRDIGLGLMGMVAERRAVRIAQVMAEYGIGDGD